VIVSPSVLFKIGNISENFEKKIKRAFYIQRPFFFKNFAASEKMWRNIIEPDGPLMTTWHMQMATNSHLEYVIYIPFPLQK
jgi:hypothetical protein